METTRKIRTSANYSPTLPEIDWGVSETIPNMVPDLRSMIHRKQAGLSVPIFNGQFSESDYPDFYKMDTIELIQYRESLAKQMEELNKDLFTATKTLEGKQNKDMELPPPPAELKPNENF